MYKILFYSINVLNPLTEELLSYDITWPNRRSHHEIVTLGWMKITLGWNFYEIDFSLSTILKVISIIGASNWIKNFEGIQKQWLWKGGLTD